MQTRGAAVLFPPGIKRAHFYMRVVEKKASLCGEKRQWPQVCARRALTRNIAHYDIRIETKAYKLYLAAATPELNCSSFEAAREKLRMTEGKRQFTIIPRFSSFDDT